MAVSATCKAQDRPTTIRVFSSRGRWHEQSLGIAIRVAASAPVLRERRRLIARGARLDRRCLLQENLDGAPRAWARQLQHGMSGVILPYRRVLEDPPASRP